MKEQDKTPEKQINEVEIGRRTDKWPGRVNGGNHCHKTEYRKKNLKK